VNGRVTLRRSDLANLISVETPPTDSDTDSWTWDFSDLAPGQQERISFVFEIADASFIGDTIYMPADLFIDTGSDYDFIERYNFSSEVNCAYDPNDKQSYPQRSTAEDYDQNYTLFDETIDYTIRFQNTGTDTAFNIVIRDTLSTDLEIGTLNPLGASHPMQPEIDYTTNSVAFYFRDIQLVDSFTNEALSHGFVQFSIKTLPGIAEETLIENKAGIYFDFNEPIITNTVDNLMVSELPTSSISESSLSLGAFPLFPNPVDRLESFMISELPEGEKKIKILNVNSELVYQTETGTDQFEFNNLNLNAGVFFILVEVKGNTWIEKLIVLK